MFDIYQNGEAIIGVNCLKNSEIFSENLKTKQSIQYQKVHIFMISGLKVIEDRDCVISGSFLNTIAEHKLSTGNLVGFFQIPQFSLHSIIVYQNIAFLGFNEDIRAYNLNTHKLFPETVKSQLKNIMISHLYRDPNSDERKGYKLIVGGKMSISIKVFSVDKFFESCETLNPEYYTRLQPIEAQVEEEIGSDQEIELDMSDFDMNSSDDEDVKEFKKEEVKIIRRFRMKMKK